MKTIKTAADYKIGTNGSTFFVSNQFDCIFTASTLRKANNFLNRTLKDAGLV